MRVEKLKLVNFRCFEQFELDLDGESLVVVGTNAAGKSTLLNSVRMALQGGIVRHTDLRDLQQPAELIATITGIPPAGQGAFADATDFTTTPPTLRIGIRGIWDPDEREVESTHGFPDDGWRRASRAAREHLPVMHLPAWRDAKRLTQLVGRESLLEELILGLALDEELEEAIAAITTAGQQLAQVAPVKTLLGELSGNLGGFLSDVNTEAYALGLHAAQPRDVLSQLELLLARRGPQRPAAEQSDGLAQGTVFALTLALLKRQPDALLLVDEPEAALHPQAQRALVGALRTQASQSLISTHSAAVLDRANPRMVLRLRREPSGDTGSARATGMPEVDAARLSRYSTSLTAEAYFAETTILVEGFSDLLAVRVLAERTGVHLDGAGVSVISLEGKTMFKHYLQLLGPEGLDVKLRGVCDLDAETGWISRLADAGLAVTDRATLNAVGFHVCDPDLEGELLAAFSDTEIQEAFDSDGPAGQFTVFCQLPENAGRTTPELQAAYMKKDKIRWAPVFAGRIPVGSMPAPVSAVLSSI
jgi:ABC-type lipoprotein export system ATPase subunit